MDIAQNNTPEISIIVPVYKVEKYLKECLDSVKAQTFIDWECIIVDDGSPDQSGAISDGYATLDPRFRVIHQANCGVSGARNTGLKESRGRFISFVDPDDSIKPGMLARAYELMMQYEADVVQVSYNLQYTGYSRAKSLVPEVTVYDRKQIVKELLCGHRIPNYLWNKLYRRDVITSTFPEGHLFEDIFVMSRWIKNINKMVIAPDVLCDYRQRSGSIVHSYFAKNRLDYIVSMRSLAQSLKELEPTVITEDLFNRFTWICLIKAGKDIARNIHDSKACHESLACVTSAMQDVPLPSASVLGLKRWFRGWLLLNHLDIFIRLMRLVYKTDFYRQHNSSNLFD